MCGGCESSGGCFGFCGGVVQHLMYVVEICECCELICRCQLVYALYDYVSRNSHFAPHSLDQVFILHRLSTSLTVLVGPKAEFVSYRFYVF